MFQKYFTDKLDPNRATHCGNCFSTRVIVEKKLLRTKDKSLKKWMVKMRCLDCRSESEQLPLSLFDMKSLPILDEEARTRRHKAEYLERRKPLIEKYDAYLSSKEWKEKTNQWKKETGYRCEKCFRATSELHAHHLTYAHFMNEPREDVAILCKNCHAEAHRGYISVHSTVKMFEKELRN